MLRRPSKSTRSATLFPYTTPFRSEAALRQPHVERHLAALEAGDRDALTALLALLAAPAGLALARADAASDADFPVAGTFVVTDVVQFHVVHSLSLLSQIGRAHV